MKASKWLTYENGLVILLGLTFGFVFFDRNAIGFLGPYIVKDLGLSNAQVGYLASGLSLAWALSAYFIGAWSDRSGSRKPFLVISILVFSVCSVFSGLAAGFLMLLMARIIMGVAEGPFLPVCLTIINEESSPTRRGTNAGIVQTLFASLLGTAAAPIILIWLAANFNWRVTFFLTGIPGLICAFIVWKFVREPKRVDDHLVQQSHSIGLNTPRMLKIRNVKICSLISIFMVSWYLVSLTFMTLFFTQYRGFTPFEAGRMMGAAALCTPIAGFCIPWLSDRLGRRPVMVFFCFLSMLTPLAALYFHGPLWLLGILLFIGWSGSGTFPLFMGVIPGETVPRTMAATSMGLVVGIGELLGGTLAPTAAGWLGDMSTLAAPMLAIAACALVAGVLSLFLEETAPGKVQQPVSAPQVI